MSQMGGCCLPSEPCVWLQDFYHQIGLAEFLVPLFPENSRYLTTAGSSTITTSLITLTPMIVSPEVLEAYTYLPSCSVYVWPTEDLSLQMTYALDVTVTEQSKVMECLKAVQSRITQQNVVLVKKIEGHVTARVAERAEHANSQT